MITNNVKDRLQRPIRDVRISVTDRCNFRCIYCMPSEIFDDDFPFLKQNELLSFEEMYRLISIFAKLGAEKVRITGGEPLLRKNLHEFIQMIHQIGGIKDIALTTNGVYLVREAKKLKEAGLHRVNVSLDALDEEIFRKMNGRGVPVAAVLKGIDAALDAGLAVKVNMVVKKGINDGQILPMAVFFKEKGIPLRFIEFMDVGNTNGWNYEHVVSKKEIYETIHREMPLEAVEPSYYGEVAKRYRYVGTNIEIGFIASVTESFCTSCTRARISADGKLYTCLFASKGFDLRRLLREGVSDGGIEETIKHIWESRSDRYSDERVQMSGKPRKKIEMSYIGG